MVLHKLFGEKMWWICGENVVGTWAVAGEWDRNLVSRKWYVLHSIIAHVVMSSVTGCVERGLNECRIVSRKAYVGRSSLWLCLAAYLACGPGWYGPLALGLSDHLLFALSSPFDRTWWRCGWRTNNDRDEIRGFFATLRMTSVWVLSLPNTKGKDALQTKGNDALTTKGTYALHTKGTYALAYL
jgi:hypothetical protein